MIGWRRKQNAKTMEQKDLPCWEFPVKKIFQHSSGIRKLKPKRDICFLIKDLVHKSRRGKTMSEHNL